MADIIYILQIIVIGIGIGHVVAGLLTQTPPMERFWQRRRQTKRKLLPSKLDEWECISVTPDYDTAQYPDGGTHYPVYWRRK